MPATTFTPITCKSAVNRVKGMPFKWSLNPYRGCVHACQYCYARETHSFLGLNAGADFERAIFYKSNIAAVLRRELAAPTWARESIAIGTATDAYQAIEGKLMLTRACLEVLCEAPNPASIVTKSVLIKRDLDLLRELRSVAEVRVYFTVTTLDKNLWRRLEPGTPPPARRLETLSLLADAGIPTGVLMAPVLPGLTDSETAIGTVAEAAAKHGATSFTALPLRLAPLVRQHFLNFVATDYPHLYSRYQTMFHSEHPPEAWKSMVSERSEQVSQQFGLSKRERLASPASISAMPLNSQLALF